MIVQKTDVGSDQIQSDLAQCEYEVRQHLPSSLDYLPSHSRVREIVKRKELCMRGKGYRVFAREELKRILDCRLPDGSNKKISVESCVDAGGTIIPD